jgi:hypothetical protein
MGQAS